MRTHGSIALPDLPEEPLVSVLVASYNYARYIGRALGSLGAQSYARFEAVVCDDGSTDASREIVSGHAFGDARIRLIVKENGGVASALNAAYRACGGDIICLLDADDFFFPDKLARVVRLFRNRPEAGMALHAMEVVDSREQRLRRIPVLGTFEEGWIAETVRARGGRWRSMPAGALCFRRALADRLFPIPEASFRSEADGYLSVLAAMLTTVAFLPETLAGYRLHEANLTGALRLDRAVYARHLDALRRIIEAVNQRLTELQVPGPLLSIDANLNYREDAFSLALFDGEPRRALWRAFVPLARALLADDLYAFPRKALGIVAFGTAVLLPARLRPSWLRHALDGFGLRGRL
ncbi:MAG: glycosyltransferase [Rhodothermales bacterium]